MCAAMCACGTAQSCVSCGRPTSLGPCPCVPYCASAGVAREPQETGSSFMQPQPGGQGGQPAQQGSGERTPAAGSSGGSPSGQQPAGESQAGSGQAEQGSSAAQAAKAVAVEYGQAATAKAGAAARVSCDVPAWKRGGGYSKRVGVVGVGCRGAGGLGVHHVGWGLQGGLRGGIKVSLLPG